MENKTVKLLNLQCKELDEVIASLVAKYKTDYIFCFSCLNDTKTTTSCFAGDIHLSDTHYFLLMITMEITRIEHEVQDYVNTHFENGTITIIVHGMETVTNAIAQGSRFFTTVCRDGLQLYSASGLRFNNDAVFEELSPNQARDLQLGMRHFFVNYPHEEVKRIIWELYRGWVFNSAEYVQQEEITDMLLFYEAILEFTGDVHSYCQYLDRTVLKNRLNES